MKIDNEIRIIYDDHPSQEKTDLFNALNSNTPRIEGLMSSINCPKPLLYSDKNLGLRLQDYINHPVIIENPYNIMDDMCKKATNNFIKLEKPRL